MINEYDFSSCFYRSCLAKKCRYIAIDWVSERRTRLLNDYNLLLEFCTLNFLLVSVKFNPGFFLLCLKVFSLIIFCAIFRASNHQLVDKKN